MYPNAQHACKNILYFHNPVCVPVDGLQLIALIENSVNQSEVTFVHCIPVSDVYLKVETLLIIKLVPYWLYFT